MPRGPSRSLQSIEKQIAFLQAEAEALKDKDKRAVIERINEAIRHYGIESNELAFAGISHRRPISKPHAGKPSRRAGKPANVKFRDGENTWAGRGKRPVWLNEKLNAGAKLEDFLVK